ncbi:MAG: DNA polymerase III [Myxococcales bacterium]|nr:DNA polymerase III [Myxococcales bacterium]
MRNADYAAILSATAALLEISGGNVYRVRAFERAARTLKRHPSDINPAIEDGSVKSLSGIGKSIAEDLKALQQGGSFELFEELRAQLPDQILDLLQVQGLGPKKVKALYEKLDVGNLDDLERVIDSGEVAELKGFGAKTQENIRREIDRLRRQAGRVPLPQAMSIAAPLLKQLRAIPAVERADLAGSARRWRETVKDIDFVAASADPEAVMEAFVNLPQVTEVIARGPTKTSVFLPGDLQADLRVVAPDRFGSALHHFTGSKEHHVELRARAKGMGLKISEYGVFQVDDDSAPIASATEEEVYAALGLPFIPPEMREASGELKAAEANTLPALIALGDIRGDLHMHTTASDGRHSIEEMARAALDMGYAYIAITDHSQASTVANGLSPERLERHMEAIDEVNAQIDGIEVLKGIEVDILRDGELDLPHDLLKRLDYVVASVHSSMKLDRDAMTQRVIRAIASGCVHCVGHPTGRILGGRDPFELDLDAVIEACLEHRVALEINASYGRLDLTDTHARMAADAGVPLIISTDSHTTEGLDQMIFGVKVAQRAWLAPEQVLNTRSWDDLKGWFGRA